MRKSLARRALEAALREASPADKPIIAARLADCVHKEDLARGRRRRATAAKPKPEPANVDDSNEIFDVNDGQPPYVPVLTPTPAPLPIKPEPPAVEIEPEIAPFGNGHGETRVISAMAAPGSQYWDPIRGGYYEDFDPQSSIGKPAYGAAFGARGTTSEQYYNDTGEFESERAERLRREEEEQWRDKAEKLYGR